MSDIITSTQNPKIKSLVALQQKSSERRKAGLFVVEGYRELTHCIDSGYVPDTIFYCPEILDKRVEGREERVVNEEERGKRKEERVERKEERVERKEEREMHNNTQDGNLSTLYSLLSTLNSTLISYEVSRKVYEKIAYRGSTEGVIAEIKTKEMHLGDLRLPENPLIIVLERVEKPGNLGAVLRSADAAAADAVIVCDPLTDLYNPNLIRSSIGAIFTVPTVACTSEECIAFLKEKGIRILTAQLQDSHLYYDTDMRQGTAIVMGTESTGLTNIWREAADAHIRIPMKGQLDSLNVSVSAAILLFEAVRQRG